MNIASGRAEKLMHNKLSQRTFDPPTIFAVAKTVVASNATELKRWAPK